METVALDAPGSKTETSAASPPLRPTNDEHARWSAFAFRQLIRFRALAQPVTARTFGGTGRARFRAREPRTCGQLPGYRRARMHSWMAGGRPALTPQAIKHQTTLLAHGTRPEPH